MEKKGLCSACMHDKECTFPRNFPVLEYEEFSGYELKPTKARETKRKKK